MTRYLVLTPEWPDDTEERTVFIRDGFSLLAFLFPVPWLLLRRLWFHAIMILAATTGMSMLGASSGHGVAATLVTTLLFALVGLEANHWRAQRLIRHGYAESGIVHAASAADAEIIYFHDRAQLAPPPPEPAAIRRDKPVAGPAMPVRGGMVGLVGHRGDL